MAVTVPPNYFDPSSPHPQPASGQVNVGSVPVIIIPQNYRRFSASIKNTGNDGVWVGPRGSATPNAGHLFGPGEVINWATPGELWGVANSGTQLVTYLDEMIR